MAQTLQPRKVQEKLLDTLLSNLFLATEKLKLFQNDIPITTGMVLGDLTEATFTGYAEVVLNETWLGGLDVLGKATLAYPANVAFTQTAATVTNIVYGMYIVNTTENVLLAVARFPEPVLMDLADNIILVKPIIAAEMYADSHQELLMGE